MLDRLKGLSDVEQLACRIAEQALGVVATAHDLPPRQSAVDAFLEYPDDRHAAFEVTHLAMDGGASQWLAQKLHDDRFGWPLPGAWWWRVQIGNPQDLRRLRRIFNKVVLLCEKAGVTRPQFLAKAVIDADVRWLTDESSVQMWGHPAVPAADGQRVRRAMITQPGAGGFSDETFSNLAEALTTIFGMQLVQNHVAKLRREPADERHLFLIINVYDLPFPLFEALGFSDNVPPGAPELPDALTHLWLAPVYGRRVLIGTARGWTETRNIPAANFTLVAPLPD